MSIVRIGLNDGGKEDGSDIPPSFDPTGRSYEHHGLTSRHETDGPGGDEVDDGADVEAQSLEQQCLADVVFTWGLDFI